ncbi:MAG: hypothetical protein HYT63_02690, partial [Candidatus Yanofskybacteria bacterium]|nr:hypothetical protein [Candidatus Yanofskybacteria bacterium]
MLNSQNKITEIKTSEFLDDQLAPSAVNISSNNIQIGDRFARTLFLSTLPRYLNTQWFSPVINLDRILDISIYFHPADSGTILKKLRDKLARLQAEAIEEANQGKVRNPILDTAISDIEDLRDTIQQGTDRFFEFGVYVTIYGQSEKDLDETESKIRGIFEAQLIYLKPATFRMKEGFLSTLPLDNDLLNAHSSLNTQPISSVFPFVSYDLTSDSGLLYGINTHNNSLILFDRFSLENYNSVVFGKSGGGKSVKGSEPVLIRRNGQVKLSAIGPLIEKEIAKHGAVQIDEELEGVIDPNLEVWSFDKNLKGSWSKVTVAARKAATNYFYRFTTGSGRTITTTGDHNLVTLKNGQITVSKGSETKAGEWLPLPRHIKPPEQPRKFLNLLEVLKKSNKIYVAGAGPLLQNWRSVLKKTKLDARDCYLYKYCTGRPIPLDYLYKILAKLRISLNDPALGKLKVVSRNQHSYLPMHWPINEPFLKILGYIAAEGTITENVVMISNLDSAVLDDSAKSFRQLGIPYFFGNRGINTADKPFVELIKSMGGKQKAGTKTIAPFVFGAEKSVIAAYLRAYFEGDGGVENASVSASSKSKQLVSELSYLLYYFGIVARIRPIKKKASGWIRKKLYWQLTISGQENLKKFADNINFVSKRKRNLLLQRISRDRNTNVDIIPGLSEIFKEIDRLLPAHSRR